MPKAKTNKGLVKRVRVSKTGKVKIGRAGRGHLLSKKSSKRRRHLRKKLIASTRMRATSVSIQCGIPADATPGHAPVATAVRTPTARRR